MGLFHKPKHYTFVTAEGKRVKFDTHVCADDRDAIEKARAVANGQDIEVRSGDRFIARLNAARTTAAADMETNSDIDVEGTLTPGDNRS